MNMDDALKHLRVVMSGDEILNPDALPLLIQSAQESGDECFIPLLKAMAAGLIWASVRRDVVPLANVERWGLPALLTLDDVYSGNTGPAGWPLVAPVLAWPRWIIIAARPLPSGTYEVIVRGAMQLGRTLLIDASSEKVKAWDEAIAQHARKGAHVTHALRPAGLVELTPQQEATRH